MDTPDTTFRSPHPSLSITVANRVDDLEKEIARTKETGELRIDEIQRLTAALTRETAVPVGVHVKKQELGIAPVNQSKTPSGHLNV